MRDEIFIFDETGTILIGVRFKTIKTANIPDGVKIIGERAFKSCSLLTTVTIPNSVKSIGNDAFANCCKLSSIDIPESVESIGDFAFEHCDSLTTVTMRGDVASHSFGFNVIDRYRDRLLRVGHHVFWNCRNLTSVTINENVKSIGKDIFDECENLKTIKVDAKNPWYDSRDDCNAIIETATDTLIIGCQNTIIPDSVTKIGDGAFSNCIGLKSISIPKNVIEIGHRAFWRCDKLDSINVDESNSKYDSRNNCNAVIEKSTNTLFLGCKNSIIPNSVTSIGDRAFEHCSGLTSIDIPDSVTSIGESAFDFCTNLKTITIGTGVKKIDKCAFSSCWELTHIDIPIGVESIGDRALWFCSSLDSFSIPSSLKSIGKDVFSDTGINEIYVNPQNPIFFSNNGILYKRLPDEKNMLVRFPPKKSCRDDDAFFTVDEDTIIIDEYAFQGTFLSLVNLHNNITEIGPSAFDNCLYLKKIILPDSIKTIPKYAFYRCESLAEIHLPNSSQYSIDSNAFSNCKKQGNIYSLSEDIANIKIYEEAFDDNILHNWTLHIPRNMEGAYSHHPGFGIFDNVVIE